MKKCIKILMAALLLVVASVAVTLEWFPGTAAGGFLDPYCGATYRESRQWTLSRWNLVRDWWNEFAKAHFGKEPKVVSSEGAEAKPQDAKTEAPVAKAAEGHAEASPGKPVTFSTAHWYTRKRISDSSLKGKVAVVFVWDSADAEAVEMLPLVQRMWDAYSSKAFVVVASHRGGRSDKVKSIVAKLGLTIPVCEEAGLPGEPQGLGKGPAICLSDRQGKIKYIGRNDKAVMVKLADLLCN